MSDEKIPHYINDPIINAATAPELKLYRPQIRVLNAFLYICGHFMLAFIITIFFQVFFRAKNPSLPCIFVYSLFALFVITMRFTLIWFVRLYQFYAKSETRLRCCMTPSCSEYAVLALKKYGAIFGTVKTIRRLLRCHPPGGVDYP